MITKQEVVEILYDVIDPETKINIYDLGIVYNIDCSDDCVIMDVTLTSAGCPLAKTLEDDIKKAFLSTNAKIVLNWIWNPPWTIDRITQDGKDQLVSIGFPMKLLEKSTWKKRERSDFNE